MISNALRLKNRLSCELRTRWMQVQLAKNQKAKEKTVILIATPSHGNLGDQAIVYAQRCFLTEMMPEYAIFEIQRYQYELAREYIKDIIKVHDLILIDGGGNVGTLWPEENDKIDDIVVRFCSSPIAIFPQTAYFEDSSFGTECKCRVAEAYAKNPNLLFFSRDRTTFEAMNEIIPHLRNLYLPDIVLYLDESHDAAIRDGALLCLRADKERVTEKGGFEAIRLSLEARDLVVRESSTVVNNSSCINMRNRERVLEVKWAEFRSAEVVVTDRLHGMLFSAITGTPCVALDNVSHKVSQGYEWIKYLKYIKLAKRIEDVPALVDEVLSIGPCRYDRTPLDPYFDQMKMAIRSVLR